MSSVSLAQHAPLDLTGGTDSLALRIFAWNAAFGGGAILLASLFRVGRLPLGCLAPWAWFIAYGLVLGSNSFAFPSPGGKNRAAPLDHLAACRAARALRVPAAAAGLANANLSSGIDRGSTFASSGCDGSRTLG